MSTLFLYTDSAEITDDLRTAMIAAGYLPVRVADVNSVRLIEPTIVVRAPQLSLVGTAALQTIRAYGDNVASSFGKTLAGLILDAQAAPVSTPATNEGSDV